MVINSQGIEIPAPDYLQRKAIFEMLLSERPCSTNINIDELAKETDKYSCSDITYIIEESSRKTINTNKDKLNQDIILSVIFDTPSSIIGKIDRTKKIIYDA